MFRKTLSFALATILITCAVEAVRAETREDNQARTAEKVKEGITRLGTGEQARVELKLRDKTKLKGYVSEVSDDHFVVVDKKTGAATRVSYGQVQQVKGTTCLRAPRLP